MVRNIDIIFIYNFTSCDIGKFIDHAPDPMLWIMIPDQYICRYVLHTRYDRKLKRKGIDTDLLNNRYEDRFSTFKMCKTLDLI